MFTPEQITELQAPLSKANVKQNPRGFDYVEGWHAIAEANRIFGFDGWNRETVELKLLGEPRLVDGKTRVGYMARVRITVGLIIRDGCGFGSGIDKDIDQAHESALKEAETDAMKRALMTFGNPFGLALYDKAKANVEAAPKARPVLTTTETSGALRMACELMRGCKTPGEFKELWESNYAGWKGVMSDAEYRLIQTVKVEMVAKLSPKADALTPADVPEFA